MSVVLKPWCEVLDSTFGGKINFQKSDLWVPCELVGSLGGVLECVLTYPGKNKSNIASPANLTIIARTASKFCAHIRAASPETFVLDLIS